MFNRLRAFLWARWEHLRQDRTSQIILLACLISFPPAYYYQQFFLRAALLAVLVVVLVIRSSGRSWSQDVTARLDPSLPVDVAFYRLFLVDPLVMGHVARIRMGLNITLSLIVFNNALLIIPMDLLLGGAFFLYFAGQEERFLFRQSQLLGVPAGGSGSGGFRSSFEYFLGHAQKNPKQWAVGTALVGGLGFIGKSTVDGYVTYRSQKAIDGNRFLLEMAAEAQKSQSRLEEAQALSRLELDKESQRFKLKEATHRSKIKDLMELDDRQTDNKIRLIRAQPPLRGPSSMDQPDLFLSLLTPLPLDATGSQHPSSRHPLSDGYYLSRSG